MTGSWSRLTVGNCLLGALWLMFALRTWRIRVLWRRLVPHFYVKDRNGIKYHFKVREDIADPPLTYIWFRGRFEAIR